MGYPYEPRTVYPKSADNYSENAAASSAWQLHNSKSMNLYARLPDTKEIQEAKAEFDALYDTYSSVSQKYTDELDTLIIKAITAPVDQFEANYEKYQNALKRSDLVEAEEAQYESYMKYYKLRQKQLKKLN